MKVEVKTETLSPVPPTVASFLDASVNVKLKLNTIDKWRTRILFSQPKQTTESWHKKIEKQIAVLKVVFPFLTERQIRGKAWKACGFTSIMGNLPRSGLSPEVKKEFFKRPNNKSHRMSRKSRIKYEYIKTEEEKLDYNFITPKDELHELQNNIEKVDQFSPNSFFFTPLNNIKNINLTQMSGVNVLTTSYVESGETKKIWQKNNKYDTKIVKTERIIPETPELSFETTVPYFSQDDNIRSKYNEIVKSSLLKNSFSTQVQISECSTNSKSDSDKTMSGLDELDNSKTSKINHSFNQNVINSFMSNLIPSTSSIDKRFSFEDQKLNSYISASKHDSVFNLCKSNYLNNCNFLNEITPVNNVKGEIKEVACETMTNTYYNNSNILDKKNFSNSCSKTLKTNITNDAEVINSEFCGCKLSENYLIIQQNKSPEGSQNIENSVKDFYTQSIIMSLPITQDDSEYTLLPSNVLLSNFCCEYDQAYTKKDLKPLLHRNYYSNKINYSLKKYFDSIISPEISLRKYFKISKRKFKYIKHNVNKMVDNIIYILEESN